jgi:hypothetical protein
MHELLRAPPGNRHPQSRAASEGSIVRARSIRRRARAHSPLVEVVAAAQSFCVARDCGAVEQLPLPSFVFCDPSSSSATARLVAVHLRRAGPPSMPARNVCSAFGQPTLAVVVSSARATSDEEEARLWQSRL